MSGTPARHVLITGALGELGTILIRALTDHPRYQLILTDRRTPVGLLPQPFVRAEITDLAAIRPLFAGVDTVVHLAAEMGDVPWEALCASNITGTYNVLLAASEAGCRRVVFASSSHVILGGWAGAPLDSHAPVCPSTLYGASKAGGEALAGYFAQRRGLSVICLRLGWVTPYDHPRLTPASSALDLVITPGDFVRLIVASIEARDELRFGIFAGLSDNKRKRLAIDETRDVLGYVPQDDAFALAWRNYRGMLRRFLGKVRRVVSRRWGSRNTDVG